MQSTSNSTATIPRRHDLDALRAIAMLLGIGLHAALAYVPLPEGGWPVQDAEPSEIFAVFMAAVHGFRMPLFFLISGFFTAMLWRKRGLWQLLVHRFQRIFIPLVIGMFTFVPAVWIVSIGAGISAQPATFDADTNLWTAAKLGDLEMIQDLLSDRAKLDALHPTTGVTPMSMAASSGQSETIELLIEHGADVNAKNRDGATALHLAVLFGQSDATRVLIDHGAKLSAKTNEGHTPADSLKADWELTGFVAGAFHLDLDRDQVMQGRKEVAEILEPAKASDQADSGFLRSLFAEVEDRDPAPSAEGLSGLFLLLFLFPFYHHLWFLAFLCWLVLAFALYALAVNLIGRKLPPWVTVSRLRYLWLIPMTLLPQAAMGLIYPTFGPDTSAGLLPMPHVLFYYAIFFFFGAIYFDAGDNDGRLGRSWRVTLPIALLVVFPIGYEVTKGGFGFGQWFDPNLHRPLSIAMQVIYVWLMTFGLMGMFRSLLSRESKVMRYVSDSSYWLYLAHLPLIIVAQAVVWDWPISSFGKFTVICVVCSALLLVSYQAFVRYTPIGTLLNGPRRRPQ